MSLFYGLLYLLVESRFKCVTNSENIILVSGSRKISLNLRILCGKISGTG
jgi:hypothetical protein